jgi:hypothetical protein
VEAESIFTMPAIRETSRFPCAAEQSLANACPRVNNGRIYALCISPPSTPSRSLADIPKSVVLSLPNSFGQQKLARACLMKHLLLQIVPQSGRLGSEILQRRRWSTWRGCTPFILPQFEKIIKELSSLLPFLRMKLFLKEEVYTRSSKSGKIPSGKTCLHLLERFCHTFTSLCDNRHLREQLAILQTGRLQPSIEIMLVYIRCKTDGG